MTIEPNWFGIIIATTAHFILNGLWFSPAGFQNQSDKAWGYIRPENWKPTKQSYYATLVSSLLISCSIGFIVELLQAQTLLTYLATGSVIGLGLGSGITLMNSIHPNVMHPIKHTLVYGGFHLLASIIIALVLFYI